MSCIPTKHYKKKPKYYTSIYKSSNKNTFKVNLAILSFPTSLLLHFPKKKNITKQKIQKIPFSRLVPPTGVVLRLVGVKNQLSRNQKTSSDAQGPGITRRTPTWKGGGGEDGEDRGLLVELLLLLVVVVVVVLVLVVVVQDSKSTSLEASLDAYGVRLSVPNQSSQRYNATPTAFWNSTILTTLPPSIAAYVMIYQNKSRWNVQLRTGKKVLEWLFRTCFQQIETISPTWKNLKCLHHLFSGKKTSYHQILSFPMFFSEWLILKPFQLLFTPSSISWLYKRLVGGVNMFQPICKIYVKLDHFPKKVGVKIQNKLSCHHLVEAWSSSTCFNFLLPEVYNGCHGEYQNHF